MIVFGSVVRGSWHPLNSDIDILLISENMPETWEKRRIIRNKITSFLPSLHPFQLHLVTKKV
ncbi:MAG: nucleotidyltransferase domain-containing protein [Candidatus Ratteibacteria bacterium]